MAAIAAGSGDHLPECIALKVGNDAIVTMPNEFSSGVVFVVLAAAVKAGFLNQALAAVIDKVHVLAVFVGEPGEVAFFVVVIMQGLAIGVGAGDDL